MAALNITILECIDFFDHLSSKRHLKLPPESGFQCVLRTSAFMWFVTVHTAKEPFGINLDGFLAGSLNKA